LKARASLRGAIGPLIVSISIDRLATYAPALWFVAICIAGAIVLLLSLGRYPMFVRQDNTSGRTHSADPQKLASR
jgi:hypothetical protein